MIPSKIKLYTTLKKGYEFEKKILMPKSKNSIINTHFHHPK